MQFAFHITARGASQPTHDMRAGKKQVYRASCGAGPLPRPRPAPVPARSRAVQSSQPARVIRVVRTVVRAASPSPRNRCTRSYPRKTKVVVTRKELYKLRCSHK